MSLALSTYASEWNPQNNNENNSGLGNQNSMRGLSKARTLKNRTRLQRDTDNSQVKELKDLVYGDTSGSNNKSASNGLGDFIPHPESAGGERKDSKQPMNVPNHGPAPVCELESGTDGPCSVEGFDDLANAQIDDYYTRSVPMYQEGSMQTSERDMLLAKLNYMIHLLEEQRDERTGHVTEEIILYSFLGIFMIFIVDSFARAGKYVR